jgi:hypothetical protein
MASDGVLTEAETLGNLPIGQSSSSELQDFDFAFAQTGAPSMLRDHARAMAEFVVLARNTTKDVVCPRCTECAKSLDRG